MKINIFNSYCIKINKYTKKFPYPQIIMSNTRKFRLQPSEDDFDHKQQTVYCINFSKIHQEHQKKQSFQNKVSLDYSLQKINREKYDHQTSIDLLAIQFLYQLEYILQQVKNITILANSGNKYCNAQYSSDIFKQTRRKLMSQWEQRQSLEKQKNKEQLKKFRQIITKKKNQQGGIDSFWIFKKSPIKQQKKRPKGGKGSNEGAEDMEAANENKIQQAYFKILMYAKLPLQLENSLIPKNTLKNYISSIFGETFCLWFISFYQLKSYINFKQFENISQKFKNISLRECHLVSFFLYDDNGDGFLCPRDLFAIFQRQISPKIDQDILKIGEFIKNHVGIQNTNNEQFKIQNVCIRDDWLTIKDYQIYFKKVDQPYLKATNKKDTVFSKSFAVLDHRQKVRSKRREMNEKKNLYEQLYGQISKLKKNQAHIDTESVYKLNYTLFYQIFGKSSTQLFQFFVGFLFGIQVRKYQ